MTSVVSLNKDQTAPKVFAGGINRICVFGQFELVATSDVEMNVTVKRADSVLFHHNFTSLSEKSRPMDRIRGLAFAVDGSRLYIAAGDKILGFDTKTWAQVWAYEPPRSFGFLVISPISLDVSSTGELVASFDNGSLLTWDSSGNKRKLIRDNDAPRWLRFVDEGKAVMGSDSFSISTWPMGEGERKQRLPLRERAFGFDAHRSGRYVATRELVNVVVWDVVSQQVLGRIPVQPGIPLMAFHPVKPWLVYGEKNHVFVIDVHGNQKAEFDLPVASALSIGFPPSGDKMVIGCTDHQIFIENLTDLSD